MAWPLLLLLGCSGSDAPPSGRVPPPITTPPQVHPGHTPRASPASPVPEPTMPAFVLDVPKVSVVRSVAWPGGGRELTVRVITALGTPVVDPVLDVTSDPVASLQTRTTPTALDPGYTALVLPPGATRQQVDAAAAFVDTRPASEQIGLFLTSEPPRQLTGFTTTRDRIHQVLDRVPDLTDAPTLDLPGTLEQIALWVDDVGGNGPRGMRAAVVVTAPGPLDLSTDVPFLRIDAGEDVTAASAWLDTLAAEAHHTVAVCGPLYELPGTVAWKNWDDGFRLKATLPEEVSLPCDVAAIGPGLRDRPDTLDFQFTADELAVYEERLATDSEEDFTFTLDLGGGRDPIAAVAHLRGNGSFTCPRRNYVLQLADGEARPWHAESFTDEFSLISMCNDEAYVEQHLANQLMTEAGSFALKFRYVELKLDGQTRGVYLLLEKAREELVRDQTNVRSVLRRGYSDYAAKWQYADDLDAAVLAAESITADLTGLQGTDLLDTVADRLDLERYLRWVALMSVLENGDYIDEAWFTSADAVAADGSTYEYFVAMGWDADDLYSACHSSGANAWPDPWELAYCAEDALDFTLLADPVAYDRFVDTLDDVLSEVPPARFGQAALTTGSELLPFFDRPGVAAAMTELGLTDPVAAKAAVQAHLDALVDEHAARHQTLLDRIDAYRVAYPP